MDDQPGPDVPHRRSRRRTVGIATTTVAAGVALAAGAFVLIGALDDESGAGPMGGPGDTRPTQESAAPGDDDVPKPAPGSFESTGEHLLVGTDIAPGLYVARDAAPLSIDGGLSCFWSVSDEPEWHEDGYYDAGDVEDGTAMLLASLGLWVHADPSCGTWEAVDPETAFQGADGTVASEGRYVVGRDIVAGIYLSEGPVDAASLCSVVIREYLDPATSPGDARYPHPYPAGGSIAVDLRVGDIVDVYECPPFALTDVSAAVAEDRGAPKFDDGTWLLGVDVRSGAYRAAAGIPAGTYCEATVWSDYRGPDTAELITDIRAAWSVEPAEVHLEPGQVISTVDCGTWERTGP